jgi:4-amino-4-deoxy-L-arabinose transferase-like glycosyltransferase
MARKYIKDIFFVLLPAAIFLAAFYIRFYNLGLMPINYDEAHWARYLFCNTPFIKKFIGIPISVLPYFLKSFLANRLPAVTTLTLIDFFLHMRFMPVFIGASTVLLVYLLAKKLYGFNTGIISSLILSFLPWHIIQSRIMGVAIQTPLFGSLIILALIKAAESRRLFGRIAWFLLASYFLKEALGGYNNGILFIPIFFIVWLYLNKKRKGGAFFSLAILLVAILFIIPFIAGIIRSDPPFFKLFYRSYHKNPFEGPILLNLADNLKNNFPAAIKELFFGSKLETFLYGAALKGPLLLHPAFFIIFMLSLAYAVYKRRTADKIMLSWLFIGFFGVILGVSGFAARYALIILPPMLILTARLIADALNRAYALRRPITRGIAAGLLVSLLFWISFLSIIKLMDYYAEAPLDFEECRQNSFGCKEAAEYLSGLDNLEEHGLTTDARMTTSAYMGYYLFNQNRLEIYYNNIEVWGIRLIGKRKISARLYIVWAPESHPKEYWDGLFSGLSLALKDRYPDVAPIKTIYYPNGIPAVRIFKIIQKDSAGPAADRNVLLGN